MSKFAFHEKICRLVKKTYKLQVTSEFLQVKTHKLQVTVSLFIRSSSYGNLCCCSVSPAKMRTKWQAKSKEKNEEGRHLMLTMIKEKKYILFDQFTQKLTKNGWIKSHTQICDFLRDKPIWGCTQMHFILEANSGHAGFFLGLGN